jgi:nucleoside-diphosphate-sugar epimerase
MVDIDTLLRERVQYMQSLVILGANGFLGNAFIARLDGSILVKAVVRNISSATKLEKKNVVWFEADISIPDSLNGVIQKDDIVLNLAYIASGSNERNLQLIDNIINICINNKASRLVHCSTAVVVGSSPVTQITEEISCAPLSTYEKNKWILEQNLLSTSIQGLDVGILRPTAIIGPGGKNLLKLANSLKYGNRFVNYIRSCLFSHRPMHLVPVNDVAAALLHLAFLPGDLNRNVYIISADDDPNNNFNSVENILFNSLDLKPRFFPVIPLPLGVLSFLLRVRGRSASNMKRRFSYGKIRSIKFKRKDTLINAIHQFSEAL